MNFIKYQSLGNDFIIISGPSFSGEQAARLCDRHYGIGADGILFLNGHSVEVINSDGSKGGLCLNGLRCVAHYLAGGSSSTVALSMAGRDFKCIVNKNSVTSYVGKVLSIQEVHAAGFAGYYTDIGNPHFIVFEEISSEKLEIVGSKLQHDPAFPAGINVEFVWQTQDGYKTLVYERGCGQTLACSSGASAIMQTLQQIKKITLEEIIKLEMSGGTLTSWIDAHGIVVQQADASPVFSGSTL
jgi:diaminopimelate epimerase